MTDMIKTKISIYKYVCSLWLLLHAKQLEWRLCLTLTQFSTLFNSNGPWEIGPSDFLLSKSKKSYALWGSVFTIILSERNFLYIFVLEIRLLRVIWIQNNKRENTLLPILIFFSLYNPNWKVDLINTERTSQNCHDSAKCSCSVNYSL